ncbi:MAG: phosphatase PAP2 family protein [Prevotellaceae bacterium]|nr:phosphatase PAP2 family protein [Prevotellaceae bacterium]
MKYILLLLILTFILLALPRLACIARAQDSTMQASRYTRFPYKQQITPTILIAAGTVAICAGKEELIRYMPQTNITVDNYLQYAPMLGMYAADIAGVKAQNSVWDQTKYLIFSQLACALVVQTLKYTVREQRPNKGAYNSFPSGHTSVAFVGATVMYHEFKSTNRILAYSGFFVATAVGVLRQTNRKHYISDVLAGAGIGMLSANLIYYFKPLKAWQPFSKSNNFSLLPYYNGESAGLSLTVKVGDSYSLISN